MGGHTTGVFNIVSLNLPYTRGPLDKLLFDVVGRFISRPAGLECCSAASGEGGVTHCIGVTHERMNVLSRYTEHLRHMHGHGCTSSADVR